MRYSQSSLPYDYSALEPVISKEIMELHHSKHHAGYVAGANKAIEELELARAGKKEVNLKAVMRDLSFNVNGHLMHEVFWTNMRPAKDDNRPETELLSLLTDQFGSYDSFKTQFAEAGKSVEGSGWVVLAGDKDKNMMIYQVEKHNLLHLAGFTPLLVNDVWEHAYYLDYKNDRGAYVENWWKVVNWDDVSTRISKL